MNTKIKIPLVADLEIVLLCIIAYSFFLFYGPIGFIASHNGTNYANFLITKLDFATPYNPIFILFYIPAEFVIVLAVVLVRIRIGANLAIFQQLACSVILFLTINYLLFLLFPSSAIDLYGIPTTVSANNILDRLVMLMYRSTSPWNSNPSLHIGMSWFIFRFFAQYYRFWGRTIYLLWFVGMAIGTLVLKVHMIFNILFAIILSQVCFFIFMKEIPIQFYQNLFNKVPAKIRFLIYVTVLITTTTILTFYTHKHGWYPIIRNYPS